MFSFFNLNKKTSSMLLITLCLFLISLPITQSKPKSNLRSLASNTELGCWLEAYGREQKPLGCPDGFEESGSLCYPACKEGFTGNGPVCWQNCPSGFTNTGADCLKPSSYGRGSGYASWHESECDSDNSQGCEKYGGMWYPKCAENFHAVGCCVCSPDCPNDMTDIGVSCQKQSYGRGVGKPLSCPDTQDEDAGICYNPCKKGYKGIGPICWGSCPNGMYQCAGLCVENEEACDRGVLQTADDVRRGLVQYAFDNDFEGGNLSVYDSGVNIGQLSQYGRCTNM